MVFKKVVFNFIGISLIILNFCYTQDIVYELIDWSKYLLAKNELLPKQKITTEELQGLWQIAGFDLEFKDEIISQESLWIGHIIFSDEEVELVYYIYNDANSDTIYSDVISLIHPINMKLKKIYIDSIFYVYKSDKWYFIKNIRTNKSQRLLSDNHINDISIIDRKSVIGYWCQWSL